MKFDLIIKDATQEEILKFLSGVSTAAIFTGGNITTQTPSNVLSATTMPGTDTSGDDDGPINENASTHDSAGMPWDARIHSKNKATNADGTWRKRRGVQDAVVTGVEAELRNRGAPQMQHPAPMFTETPPQMPPMMPMQPMPMQPQPMMQQPQMPPQTTMQHMPPQMPMQGQQQPVQPQQMDFGTFMAHLQQQMAKHGPDGLPLINIEYLAQVCSRLSQMVGTHINAITDIMNNPAWINAAVQIINADGRW